MVRIEDWALVPTCGAYSAPEMGVSLNGHVFGHLKKSDGTLVRTSRIVGIDADRNVITESGTRYTLGLVNKQYEQAFPNAYDRIVSSLQTNVPVAQSGRAVV